MIKEKVELISKIKNAIINVAFLQTAGDST